MDIGTLQGYIIYGHTCTGKYKPCHIMYPCHQEYGPFLPEYR